MEQGRLLVLLQLTRMEVQAAEMAGRSRHTAKSGVRSSTRAVSICVHNFKC